MEMEQGHYALRSRSRSSSRTPLIQSPAVIEQEVSNHHYKLRIYERRNSHSPEDISHREKSDYKFLIGSGNKTIKQSLKTIVENKKEIITEESFLKDENQKTWDSFPSTRNVDYPYKDQNTRQFTLVNGKLEDQSSILGYQTAKSIKEISPCRTLTNDYTSIEGQHKHISNMHSYAGSYRQYETNTSRMWRNLDHILQFVYLFMVRVLLFDAWLLSRVSHLRRWIYQRSPKLLWVAFLPLLAFVGSDFVQRQLFICLDFLHNIAYNVTDMSYRIFNYSLTSFESNSFVQHIKGITSLSLYSYSDVKTS